MDHAQWLLITLTCGVGGSLLSIGSAAGVALMGTARGQYSFTSHLRWSWAIALGFVASVLVHLAINGPHGGRHVAGRSVQQDRYGDVALVTQPPASRVVLSEAKADGESRVFLTPPPAPLAVLPHPGLRMGRSGVHGCADQWSANAPAHPGGRGTLASLRDVILMGRGTQVSLRDGFAMGTP